MKQVNLKELLSDYKSLKPFNSDPGNYQDTLVIAKKIADYILRCQDFDPTIIDTIVEKSSDLWSHLITEASI